MIGFEHSPFLKIGEIFACFQSSGREPVSSDFLNDVNRTGYLIWVKTCQKLNNAIYCNVDVGYWWITCSFIRQSHSHLCSWIQIETDHSVYLLYWHLKRLIHHCVRVQKCRNCQSLSSKKIKTSWLNQHRLLLCTSCS